MKVRFDDVLYDCTKNGTKIQTDEYLPMGNYPIVDQGKNDIAGYRDDASGLFADVPVIIFGDHTRIVKYVDTPCFLGADGVKLLRPRHNGLNCKYLFYHLQASHIPNTGYNRHFKWVRELCFNIPSFVEQSKIVSVLDALVSLISLRKQQLAKLDELVKSRFVEMFGDCTNNTKGWKTKRLEEIASVGSSKRVFVEDLKTSGIPFYRGTEVGALAEGYSITSELFITKEHYKLLCESTGAPQTGDLLMPSICPDGRIWVVNTTDPFYFKDGRVLWVHSIDKRFDPVFLLYTLKDRIMTDYSSIASGTTFAELKIFSFAV